MTPDEELVLIFGALHLVAAVLGGVLLVMFMRSEETTEGRPPSEDDDPGGGGNDRTSGSPKHTPPPPGGIPLPHAEQSRTRFRGPARLADAYQRRRSRVTPERAPDPQRPPARRR